MLVGYFTEQPMSAYPEADALQIHPDDHPARKPGDTVLLFSNKYFDSVAASRLYSQSLEQYRLVDEVGYDAIMTNEHHTAAFCMQARCSISSAFAAAVTKRVMIMQCGNPLPLWDNPVQLAEEIAMIDLMSGGRLISGIIRGGGAEQLANNVNPAYNRDRFNEAHDLIIKTWTVPGPWRWEGEHYQLRVVNPWVLPLQKPHPRIFVPGVTSKETVEWAADHAYPYIALSTTEEETQRMWSVYDQRARDRGYEAGPQHRGYLMRCHVAATEEKAIANARQYLWMRGEFTGISHPVWQLPAGYTSVEARRAKLAREAVRNASFEEQLALGTIIAGTPQQVVKKIRHWLEKTGVGILVLWGNEGKINHEDALESIRLTGSEVIPAVREIGKELGLSSPFDVDAPVSLEAARAATSLSSRAAAL